MVTPTTTSERIINYLKTRKFELSPGDKRFIREAVYDAVTDAAEWESNGCDCGQMSCPICHG